MTLKPGDRLGRYEILAPLGAGGMGEVYVARDSRLPRDVALKVLPEEFRLDPDRRARFEREARAVASLNHEHVVTIHDFGETDGVLHIAFELIRGETLEQRLAKSRLGATQAVRFASQIANGLAHAHAAGVVHRDLKPRNIMITATGQIKVLDFGLGKFVEAAPNELLSTAQSVSQSGAMLGTVGYMSPEQVRGDPIDARSDQFVLGVVLYEMLTGARAFHRDSALRTLLAILEEEPEPVHNLAPQTPPVLAALVARCMAKQPADRFRDTHELLGQLEAIEASTGQVPSVPRRTWKWATVSVVLASAMVAGLWTWDQSRADDRVVRSRPSATLALLPIQTSSGDEREQAYWAGLTQALVTRLGALAAGRSLHVTPFSDVLSRRVRDADDARIELGATHVLGGTADDQGGSVRVRLELVDAGSNRVMRGREVTASHAERGVLHNRLLDAVLSLLDVTPTERERATLTAPAATAGADDFYLQGLGYLQDDGRPESVETAITLFQRAIDLDPRYAPGFAGLGEAYWRKYLTSRDAAWATRARQTCERALGVDERAAAPHRCLGVVATGIGDYEKSVEEFQHALDREPESELARIGLATAYERLGLADRAEQTFLDAIDVRPRYWSGYSRLGAFYYTQRRYADAEKMFRRGLELHPDSWRGYSNLGALLFVQGRVPEAIDSFQKSMAIRPNYQAASNLGTLYFFETRDYARAADAFSDAVKLDQNEYLVWGNLADALHWAARRAESKKAYARAAELAEKRLAVNPRDARVTMSLAGYLAALGQVDRAGAMMEKAIALAPDDARLMFQAAVVTEHSFADRGKALEWLARAIDAGFSWREVQRSPALDALRQDQRSERLRSLAQSKQDGAKGG